MAHIFSFDPSPPHPASPWENKGDDSEGMNTQGRKKTPPSRNIASSNKTHGNVETHKSIKSLVGTKGLISEPQVGSTEYKLHLLKEGKSSIRLEQLTTQLLWRLQQSNPNFSNAPGGGSNKPQHIRDSLQDSQGALYELGVCDDGTLVGLLEEELEQSLDTLRLMASKLGCAVWVLRKVRVGEVTPEDAARNSSDNYPSGEWDDREDMGRRRGSKTGALWVAEAFVKPIISKEDEEMGTNNSSSGPALEGTFVVKEDIIPPATEQLKISLTGTTTSGKSTLLGTLTSSQADNGRGKSRLGLFRHRHELVSGVTSSVAQEILGYKPYSVWHNRGGEVINYSYGNISSWTDVHTAISNMAAVPDTDRNGRVVLLSDTAGHPRYRRTTIRSLVGWAPHYAFLLIPGDEPELSDASKRHLQLVLKLGLRLVILITKLDIARRDCLRVILQQVLSSLRDAGRDPQTINSPERHFSSWSDQEEKGVRKVVNKIDILDGDCPGAGRKVVPIVFTSSCNGQGLGTIHALLRGLPIPKEDTKERTLETICVPGLVPVEGSSLEEVIKDLGQVKIMDKCANKAPVEDKALHDRLTEEEHPTQPIETLFHIEEVYALPSTYTFFPELTTGGPTPLKAPEGAIISGHLRYGRVSVGDELVVGPFSTRPTELNLGSGVGMTRSVSTGSLPCKQKGPTELCPGHSSFLSASSVGSLGKKGWLSDEDGTGVSSGDEPHHDRKLRRPRSAMAKGDARKKISGGVVNMEVVQQKQQAEEWRVARVVSVRRLRLPVGTLFEGEAGTLGLVCLRSYQLPATNLGNTFEAKTPEIKVETTIEKDPDEDSSEDGGVSLLGVDWATEYGFKADGEDVQPISMNEKDNIDAAVHPATGTPSGTLKAVSFAAPMTLIGNMDSRNGASNPSNDDTQPREFRLRKGMVVLNQSIPAWAKGNVEWPKAYGGFITEFTGGDDGDEGGVTATSLAIGTHVVVYCASIRAAARVVETPAGFSISAGPDDTCGLHIVKERKKAKSAPDEVHVFGFEDEGADTENDDGNEEAKKVVIAFEFFGGNEWVEVGAKVLVMSGHGAGKGLDGVVGRVVRVGL
ncbi:hypothetical protein BGX38DRAFT_1144954 [Terfezia claveryi]|nr:hypothetical protein BGX38DRAFT_1144954 [Terfezia claveryi]